jgi:hypothetical protein
MPELRPTGARRFRRRSRVVQDGPVLNQGPLIISANGLIIFLILLKSTSHALPPGLLRN